MFSFVYKNGLHLVIIGHGWDIYLVAGAGLEPATSRL